MQLLTWMPNDFVWAGIMREKKVCAVLWTISNSLLLFSDISNTRVQQTIYPFRLCFWICVTKLSAGLYFLETDWIPFPIEASLFTIEPFEHNEVRSRFTATDKKEKRVACTFLLFLLYNTYSRKSWEITPTFRTFF